MSKGNMKAQEMTSNISAESILITGESNWIQVRSFWREATGQRLEVTEGMSCHSPRALAGC